ncbi:hypothetical protein ACFL2V_14765 [Pseudomonadota bacterium]
MVRGNVNIIFNCTKPELENIVSHSEDIPRGKIRIKQGTAIAEVLANIKGKVRFGIVAQPLSVHDTLSAEVGYENEGERVLYDIVFISDQTTPIQANLPGLDEENKWFYMSKEYSINFHSQSKLYEGE